MPVTALPSLHSFWTELTTLAKVPVAPAAALNTSLVPAAANADVPATTPRAKGGNSIAKSLGRFAATVRDSGVAGILETAGIALLAQVREPLNFKIFTRAAEAVDYKAVLLKTARDAGLGEDVIQWVAADYDAALPTIDAAILTIPTLFAANFASKMLFNAANPGLKPSIWLPMNVASLHYYLIPMALLGGTQLDDAFSQAFIFLASTWLFTEVRKRYAV